jgi:hypothetical protein
MKTIVICLKHYRGVTKCLRWEKPGTIVDGKSGLIPANPYSVSYIYDKWFNHMFSPFEISIRNFLKHPATTILALRLRAKAKRGNLSEVD